MKICNIEDRNNTLISALYEVWEKSVTATHLFLTAAEIQRIAAYIPMALREIPHLIVAVNKDDKPAAFMGIDRTKLEMLFISPEERRKGLGKQLVQYGIEQFSVNELCVNEQNPQAKEFYEHIGFQVYKRTDVDEQGNPYPLLYMRLCDGADCNIFCF